MSAAKNLLGKIFVSYSAADKRFVNRLVDRVHKEGFRVWLDQHELFPGDPLAEKISIALAEARVVIVIVSSASARSKWLTFELNKATERMIHGECRVIPVIKEKTLLPPEVQGLLYADFSSSFKYGMKSVLSALEYEFKRKLDQEAFWVRAGVMLKRVFHGTGFISHDSEYHSQDFEIVSISLGPGDDNQAEVIYEIVPNYSGSRQLTERWVDEFMESTEPFCYELFLVLTERPVGCSMDSADVEMPAVTVKTIHSPEPTKYIYQWLVFVDFSKLKEESQQLEALKRAKFLLTQFAREASRRKARKSRRRRQ